MAYFKKTRVDGDFTVEGNIFSKYVSRFIDENSNTPINFPRVKPHLNPDYIAKFENNNAIITESLIQENIYLNDIHYPVEFCRINFNNKKVSSTFESITFSDTFLHKITALDEKLLFLYPCNEEEVSNKVTWLIDTDDTYYSSIFKIVPGKFFYRDRAVNYVEETLPPIIKYDNMTDTVSIKGMPGQEIYYSINNSDPLKQGTKYVDQFTVSETCTVYAISTLFGYDPSIVVSLRCEWWSKTEPPTISFESSSGTVTIEKPYEDQAIYYSINNVNPYKYGNLYNGPFQISRDCTVYAVTTRHLYKNSDPASLKCKPDTMRLNVEITDAELWRKEVLSNGVTRISIQVPDYDPLTMKILAFKNGVGLSDGSNSDLVEYTVSPTGLVTFTYDSLPDQKFMVVAVSTITNIEERDIPRDEIYWN